jgi:hypothetical protein
MAVANWKVKDERDQALADDVFGDETRWDTLDDCALSRVVQHCYVAVKVEDGDEALETWYRRAELFAERQAERFDRESLTTDPCRYDEVVEHDGIRRMMATWMFSLAWDDLRRHFWDASGDPWENERFWTLLHWKSYALRDWCSQACEEDEED